MKKMRCLVLAMAVGLLLSGCSGNPSSSGTSGRQNHSSGGGSSASGEPAINPDETPSAPEEPEIDLMAIPEAPASDFKYRIFDNGEASILRYKGSATEVGIPSRIENCPVTKIASGFENNTDIKAVRIPDGVTELGISAFKGCTRLRSVNIPSSVTKIEATVFSGCASLTSITIPEGVTKMDGGVFNGCAKLTSIHVSEENDTFCDVDGVMFSKDGSVLICYPAGREGSSYTIPEQVTRIRVHAFATSEYLTEMTIPEHVAKLDDCSFAGCKRLERVTIPDGVDIGRSVFSDCTALTDITLPSDMTEIPTVLFTHCENLKNIILPEGITAIWTQSFLGCSSLTALTLPDGMTKISDGAFAGCENLTVTFQGRQYTYADEFASLYSAINGN